MFKTTCKVNLFFDNSYQTQLNIMREMIKATYAVSWAIKCDVSEEVVFARKQHLQESKCVELVFIELR